MRYVPFGAVSTRPSGHVESFSTAVVPPSRRSAFWNDAVCRVFTQLDARPRDSYGFNASLQRVDLEDLSLSRAVSTACRLQHTDVRARSQSEEVFLLHLQANGESIHVQNGREATLRTNDFTLCASTNAYALAFESVNDMLVLRIPANRLRSRIPDPERFTAITILGNNGTGSLVSQAMQQWWTLCAAGLDAEISRRIGDNILDLLVTALCAQQPTTVTARSTSNARRLQIIAMIENRLTDPGLNAQSIAAALGLTPRYLHRMFEAYGETLGQRILRRRLEVCAMRMRDPALRARSVTDIAFDCAFSDASYFSRCFRRRFGVTPREYRAEGAGL